MLEDFSMSQTGHVRCKSGNILEMVHDEMT